MGRDIIIIIISPANNIASISYALAPRRAHYQRAPQVHSGSVWRRNQSIPNNIQWATFHLEWIFFFDNFTSLSHSLGDPHLWPFSNWLSMSRAARWHTHDPHYDAEAFERHRNLSSTLVFSRSLFFFGEGTLNYITEFQKFRRRCGDNPIECECRTFTSLNPDKRTFSLPRSLIY